MKAYLVVQKYLKLHRNSEIHEVNIREVIIEGHF